MITGRQANQRCHCMYDGGKFVGIINNARASKWLFLSPRHKEIRCDGHHIWQFSVMAKCTWPGGWFHRPPSLPYCPARCCGRGLFLSDIRVVIILQEVSEAPPSPAYCSVCPTAKWLQTELRP